MDAANPISPRPYDGSWATIRQGIAWGEMADVIFSGPSAEAVNPPVWRSHAGDMDEKTKAAVTRLTEVTVNKAYSVMAA